MKRNSNLAQHKSLGAWGFSVAASWKCIMRLPYGACDLAMGRSNDDDERVYSMHTELFVLNLQETKCETNKRVSLA